MLKKRLIPLIGLTLALVVAGVVMGFALSSGSGDEEGITGTQPPIRSDEGIDEDECNYVHNITACDGNPILEDPHSLRTKSGSMTREPKYSFRFLPFPLTVSPVRPTERS